MSQTTWIWLSCVPITWFQTFVPLDTLYLVAASCCPLAWLVILHLHLSLLFSAMMRLRVRAYACVQAQGRAGFPSSIPCSSRGQLKLMLQNSLMSEQGGLLWCLQEIVAYLVMASLFYRNPSSCETSRVCMHDLSPRVTWHHMSSRFHILRKYIGPHGSRTLQKLSRSWHIHVLCALKCDRWSKGTTGFSLLFKESCHNALVRHDLCGTQTCV